ncbi:hypothetical protein [Xanthomonas phage RTH11]|nr:hypothetical protein [Xanthomonas phage RTH11]
MSHWTEIKMDGIIKGNADIEDPAQEELRQALLEKEMKQRFPEFFLSSTTIERS